MTANSAVSVLRVDARGRVVLYGRPLPAGRVCSSYHGRLLIRRWSRRSSSSARVLANGSRVLDEMEFGGTEDRIIERGSNWCSDGG